MRVVFMGTPDYAAVILKALLESDRIEVVGVVMQPDKEVGRGKKLTPPPTKALLLERGYRGAILQPATLKSDEFYEQILQLKPSVMIVAAFGKILPKRILDIAPCYNLHASLLPKYRGASPIQDSILAGDEYTGVSFMVMEEGLDCGGYLAKSVLKVDERMDSALLFKRLAELAADLTLECLERLEDLCVIEQVSADVSYCHKVNKGDGLISFDCAELIVRKLKAYAIWPGVFLQNGLKLKQAVLESNHGNYRAGEILELRQDSVVVGCEVGALRVYALQPPSKKEMPAPAYINGKRLKCGDILF